MEGLATEAGRLLTESLHDQASQLLLAALREGGSQATALQQLLATHCRQQLPANEKGDAADKGDGDGEQTAAVAGAECLALLARSLQLTGGEPPMTICALCSCALAVDDGNALAKLVLARDNRREQRYGRAIWLAEAVSADSPCSAEAKLILDSCHAAQDQWVDDHITTQEAAHILRATGTLSPIKTLKGVGTGMAVKFEGGEATTIQQACEELDRKRDRIPGVSPAKRELFRGAEKVLSLSESSSRSMGHQLPCRDDLLAVQRLLRSAAVADNARLAKLVVGSWNAMATRPEHAVTVEMLRRKALNLADVASERGMSLLAVQECPGAYIRREGKPPARAALVAGSTLKDALLATLNKDGARKFQGVNVTVPCVYSDGTDQGEAHCLLWDTHVLQVDNVDRMPVSLAGLLAVEAKGPGDRGGAEVREGSGYKSELFHRAPVLGMFRMVQAPHRRLAVLSVHLKSGGDDKTAAEVQLLADHAVPYVLQEFCPQPQDAVLICGDFNLAPSHPAFQGLRELGFAYVCDGRPTNQAEWLRGGNAYVYDGAWLWHAAGCSGARAAGEVVENRDMQLALRDREALMALLAGWEPQSRFASELRGEMFGGRGGTGILATPNFLIDLFKRKVMADWSDHKPIAVTISLD